MPSAHEPAPARASSNATPDKTIPTLVRGAVGPSTWVWYALIFVVFGAVAFESLRQLGNSRETLIRREESRLVAGLLSAQTPAAVCMDQCRLRLGILRSQGVVPAAFDFRQGDAGPVGLREKLAAHLNDPVIADSEGGPPAVFNFDGVCVLGRADPSLTPELVRRRASEAPAWAVVSAVIEGPRFDPATGSPWCDLLMVYRPSRGRGAGVVVFPYDLRKLAITEERRPRELRHADYRLFLIGTGSLRVLASCATPALAAGLPTPGERHDLPGLDAMIVEAAATTTGQIARTMAWSHDGRPLLTLVQRQKAGPGLCAVAQCDLEQALAHWYRHRRYTIAGLATLGAMLVVMLVADIRRRRARGALLMLGAELEWHRNREAGLASIRSELERRIEARTAQLSARNAELTAVNGELDAFARTVSQDLRAPIGAILSRTEALEKRTPPVFEEDGMRLVSRMRVKALRVNELAEDILRLARVSKSKPARTPVNLSMMASAILSGLRESSPGRMTCFRIEPGHMVMADAGLARIVMENLLANAWKYSSKKRETFITFGREWRNGKSWYFVRDNGAGFDPAYADRLFRPFSRLHSAADFEGTGIGLATVARIVRLHGGEIIAEGRPGEGAVFRFNFTSTGGAA